MPRRLKIDAVDEKRKKQPRNLAEAERTKTDGSHGRREILLALSRATANVTILQNANYRIIERCYLNFTRDPRRRHKSLLKRNPRLSRTTPYFRSTKSDKSRRKPRWKRSRQEDSRLCPMSHDYKMNEVILASHPGISCLASGRRTPRYTCISVVGDERFGD